MFLCSKSRGNKIWFGHTCRFEVWWGFDEQVGVEAVDMGTNWVPSFGDGKHSHHRDRSGAEKKSKSKIGFVVCVGGLLKPKASSLSLLPKNGEIKLTMEITLPLASHLGELQCSGRCQSVGRRVCPRPGQQGREAVSTWGGAHSDPSHPQPQVGRIRRPRGLGCPHPWQPRTPRSWESRRRHRTHHLLNHNTTHGLSQAYCLDIRKKTQGGKTQNSRKKLKLKLKTQFFGIF